MLIKKKRQVTVAIQYTKSKNLLKRHIPYLTRKMYINKKISPYSFLINTKTMTWIKFWHWTCTSASQQGEKNFLVRLPTVLNIPFFQDLEMNSSHSPKSASVLYNTTETPKYLLDFLRFISKICGWRDFLINDESQSR